MGASLKLIPTPLEGAWRVESVPVEDHRGEFARLFCAEELSPIHAGKPIRQVNLSLTQSKGTIRGLHFQAPPRADIRLVRCLRGRVFDVIVDLRRGSSTLLDWYAHELSPANHTALYIPEGFAHAFQTLEPDCEMLYLHSEFYSPEHEGGIRFDDPRVGIRWPSPMGDISERDRRHPPLGDDFEGIEL